MSAFFSTFVDAVIRLHREKCRKCAGFQPFVRAKIEDEADDRGEDLQTSPQEFINEGNQFLLHTRVLPDVVIKPVRG